MSLLFVTVIVNLVVNVTLIQMVVVGVLQFTVIE